MERVFPNLGIRILKKFFKRGPTFALKPTVHPETPVNVSLALADFQFTRAKLAALFADMLIVTAPAEVLVGFYLPAGPTKMAAASLFSCQNPSPVENTWLTVLWLPDQLA